MSNVIRLVAGTPLHRPVQIGEDLVATMVRIGAAAQGLAHLDIDAESRAEALVALYEASRLIQRAAAIAERAIVKAAGPDRSDP